jgi:hypothetical protein
MKLALFATCFMLVSSLASSSTMKMEAKCSSKRRLTFKLTRWRYIRAYMNLNKWYIVFVYNMREYYMSRMLCHYK